MSPNSRATFRKTAKPSSHHFRDEIIFNPYLHRVK